VIKAQVPVGGRMKAGGVLFAADAAETEQAVQTILALTIRGYTVAQVSVQERLKEAGALYIGATIDATNRQAVLLGSVAGGIEIESKSDIERQSFALREPLPVFRARELAARLLAKANWSAAQDGQYASVLQALTDVILKVAHLFQQSDALLVE